MLSAVVYYLLHYCCSVIKQKCTVGVLNAASQSKVRRGLGWRDIICTFRRQQIVNEVKQSQVIIQFSNISAIPPGENKAKSDVVTKLTRTHKHSHVERQRS